MNNLLQCPICGNNPNLQSLEPEYQQMKYFCGVHISCGEWQSTKELAIIDWNRRVKEHEYFLIAVETPGTKEWIYRQGQLKAWAYCEDCDYETDSMPMKDLVFKVSMEGGYIASDKSGGYSSQCPKCESNNLTLGND